MRKDHVNHRILGDSRVPVFFARYVATASLFAMIAGLIASRTPRDGTT